MNSLYAMQNQEIKRLRAGLKQRDAALFVLLEKSGPQTVSQLDINEAKPGCMVVCDFDAETLTVTFRAIKPKEIHYEEVQSEKAGDQKADCGEVKAGE
jgi:hypothetical protein